MPTIHDVAKLAGVSIATVSRALNNRENVDSKTRAKVKEAAAKVGYVSRPTYHRQAPALGRGLIAVVTPKDSHILQESAIYQRGFSGFHTSAARLGWRIVFHTESELSTISPHELAQEYGGVVFFSCVPPSDPYQAMMDEMKLQFVVANRRHLSAGVSWVSIDEEAGTRVAVDRLWSIGRRRFAFFGVREDMQEGTSRWYRYHGAKQFLLEKDPGLHLATLPEGEVSVTDLAPAVKQFMTEFHPDAILVYNDAFALQVVSALQSLDIKVGDDVSVVAFDNTYLAELANPPISCVHIPLETVCALAITELDARIQAAVDHAPLAMSQTLVRPWFVPRQSCGTSLA